MVIRVPGGRFQPRVLMQKAGYAEFRDPNTGEISYVRRLGSLFYPRFHVYIEEQNGELRINLHLDQKKPSYPGFRKHSGEYAGPIVEQEADRIYAFLR